MQPALIALGITLAVSVMVVQMFRLLGKPQNLGSASGLNPCGNRPNCVCSSDARPGFHVDAWRSPEDYGQTVRSLAVMLEKTRGVRVVMLQPENGYLRAEFTTPVCRFVDDVEFLCQIDGPGSTIQVRSASRAGHSDLGLNRRRVGALHAAWLKQIKTDNAPLGTASPKVG